MTTDGRARLVADRFASEEGGRVVDLATGAPVLLTIGMAGGTSEQRRWTARGDMWRSLQHPAIASLVDCGPLCETSRFEAWGCGRAWTGSAAHARIVTDRVEAFVRAAGLTCGADSIGAVHHGPHAALVVPGDGTGYPAGSDAPTSSPLTVDCCGIRLMHQPVVAALFEMFEHGHGRRPRSVVLWGPPGSGRRTLVRELARAARTHGFVPIAAPLIGAPYAELLEGRSLFIIGSLADESSLAAALQQTTRSPRAHVMVMVSEVEHGTLESVGLPRVSPADLVSAVFPRVDERVQTRRIERAAERARGLPGRFVQLLWRSNVDAIKDRPRRFSAGLRVAEQPARYGEPDRVVESRPSSRPARSWPAPGELVMLRRRMEAAVGLIARGRHAPGIRQLRHAVGALARRDDWSAAADGALALAECLLRRGRPRDALVTIEEAQQFARAADRTSLVVDAALLAGEAWIDRGRLGEAEAVLAGTAAIARGLNDPGRVAATSLVLARCMYWRGQFTDAGVALEGAREASSIRDVARRDLLAARIAIGHGQLDRALALAASTQTVARDANDPRTLATAAYCAALVHNKVGSFDAAGHDLVTSVAAARLAHDPLRAARARLLCVEIDRRRGRVAAASAQLARLARITATLPRLVRVRSELLTALLSDEPQIMDIISRHVKTSGLGALAVYAGGGFESCSDGPLDLLASEVVAVVRACQTAEDEAVVLRDVCVRVRRHIHAAAVAIVAGPSRRFGVLASDGPRIEPAIAERAVTSGLTIAPHRLENRLEAAVPVQYGGAPIAAMCARWILGSSLDLRRAAAVLEVAAAAAAPVVAALCARADVVAPAGRDLLGVSPSMVNLRIGVERAAAAPFPVLITGESGSGKELVARAIHRLGPRRDRAFCTLNSAALPDDLVEAELFGHARGAFTGAVGERIGVFEEAHGGTLFLDEIGELSPRAQAKVLRVIQEGEVRRVGENLPRHVDVRIIAATNRDLRVTEAGQFRTDLLYRLDVVRIDVPPLRDRREDIVVLAEHFWRDAATRVASRATLGAATLAALARYDWPGNVRELQNVLAALAVRSPKRGVVPATALPPQFMVDDRQEAWRLTDARRTFEERFVRAALLRSGGHRANAAVELGLSRQGLTKLMTRLGIAMDEPSSTDL